MIYITAMIKTDFHTYFYRTIVLKKGTGKPLLDTNVLRDERKDEKKETVWKLKRWNEREVRC
jgi:hypothetical protein